MSPETPLKTGKKCKSTPPRGTLDTLGPELSVLKKTPVNRAKMPSDTLDTLFSKSRTEKNIYIRPFSCICGLKKSVSSVSMGENPSILGQKHRHTLFPLRCVKCVRNAEASCHPMVRANREVCRSVSAKGPSLTCTDTPLTHLFPIPYPISMKIDDFRTRFRPNPTPILPKTMEKGVSGFPKMCQGCAGGCVGNAS